MPSERAKALLRGETERLRQADKSILRGVGELAILVKRGQRSLDEDALDSAWRAVLAGEAGVELDDVFDPREAKLLRDITPALVEKTEPADE